jgi:hypothetical protein
VVVGNVEAGDIARVFGMVGDDARDVGLDLAMAPSPEEVEQAMVLARRKHSRCFASFA